MNPQFLPLGDKAVRIEFGDPFGSASVEVNRRIRSFCLALGRANAVGVIECVPAFATVVVSYDPVVVRYDDLIEQLAVIDRAATSTPPPLGRRVTIPVDYGGDDGPDLAEVASAKGMSEADIIRLHTSGEYLVYMLGFTPGFPYLGGLSPELVTERRATPRTHVSAGSVGLAGDQTGVYPFASPGGWNIIGRTAVALFDPQREPPALLSPGDTVKFVALEPARREEQ